MSSSSLGSLRSFAAAILWKKMLPSFGKRPQDQGNTSRKRSTPTRPATEQTPGIPADAEATMQDSLMVRCSDSAVEPDAAAEHIAPASLGLTCEASPGNGD